MPNWCSNSVTIKHKDPGMIKRAHDTLIAGKMLNEFIPSPNGEWTWDFSVTNWGTKWDVGGEGTSEKISDNEIHANFDSAWAPPTEAFRFMVEELGFEITAYYYEPGIGFVGKSETVDGQFYDQCYDYSDCSSPSEVREQIGEELDEYFGISDDMASWENE